MTAVRTSSAPLNSDAVLTFEAKLITILPEGVTAQTNKAGAAVFLLPAGDHYVNAHLCCVGPGLIEYHILVTLQAGDTTSLTLRACLTCE